MPRALALAAALGLTLAVWLVAFRPAPRRETTSRLTGQPAAAAHVVKTNDEWRRELSPLQYQVLRQKGTDRYCLNSASLDFERAAE